MLSLAIVLVLSSQPAPSPAGLPVQDPEAKAHFQRGMAYFAAEDYPAARHELELAYAREPHPDLLYARAQVQRLMGDCPAAIQLYEEFLRSEPPEVAAREARVNLERCGVPKPKDPPTAAPQQVPEPAPEPAPAPPAKPRADRLGVALVSVGGVAIAASVATGVFAGLGAAALDDAPSHRDFDDTRRQAIATAAAAGVLGGVGVALAATGIVRLVRRRSSRSQVGLGGPLRSVGISVRVVF